MAYVMDEDYRAAGNTNHISAEGRGFCIHHAAGTSIDMAPTFLANGTSAHYGVEPGHVRRFLPDEDNAWAAGDSWANAHLVHIECVNSSAGGDWPVAEGTVDTLVEFLADKCRELGYARLDVGETLYGHRDFYATFCPGALYGRLGEIADRVNALLSGASGEWVRDGKGWWYRRADGSWPAGEWLALDAWYRFGTDGYALTGWQLVDGKWYLFGDDCRMLPGWQSVGEKRYYLTGSGAMATGRAEVDGAWYYLDASGAMQTGWLLDGGKWYWLDESGAMARSSCRSIGGKWYAFGASGAMVSGEVPTGVGGDMQLG
ncbi:N-acetylmuramoyl-L-alanine amidase [Paraeggerthella sp. Marseille-Q4926]|uniref:peptidoglycan recognition protein family protein n=1 Tax=Paraeggerthella sp. Marseille-Q4926 TaxID=2866587 RepID=UPI001CE3D8BE|nr:N-acetylmuramoyl-L-alanine amidase [Paraeggerthella sp. Marseille-Q4926]